MKKLKRLCLLFLMLLGIFSSCEREEFQNDVQQNPEIIQQANLSRVTKLGKKLKNPYSVSNMQKAWSNIKNNTKFEKDEGIHTTHLYIKFEPKTEEELSFLIKDTTITFYPYPLDYEVEDAGDYYHDSSVPLNQPTYQYASYEVNKELPSNIEYEILEKLYIPDEDGDFEEGSKNSFASKEYISLLVDEALRLTNNLPDDSRSSSVSAKSKWRPSGTIKVYDHIAGAYKPVVGVEVRARRWFTTHKGITGSSGYYSCDGRFRRDANYSIQWDRWEYSIRSGSVGQATYNGPKRRGSWSLNLGSSSSNTVNETQQYYALIHQGAFDFYYGSRFGLTSPPRNSFLKRQLKIAAQKDNNQSSYVKARRIWFGADISLHAWGERSDQVYGTIVHELAHAAHRQVDKGAYNNVVWDAYTGPCTSLNGCNNLGPTGNNNRRLLETWATTVEIHFVLYRNNILYGKTSYKYFPNNLQSQTIAEDNHYTSAGHDMMDNINQRSVYGSAYPIDDVRGYNIVQLEQALKGAKSWTQWRDNIKNKYSNSTENQLNALFNNWPN